VKRRWPPARDIQPRNSQPKLIEAGERRAGANRGCHAQRNFLVLLACSRPQKNAGSLRFGTRCASAWLHADDHGRCDSAGSESDDTAEATERHPLEHAQHGPSGRNQRSQRASHLAQSWAETASHRELRVAQVSASARSNYALISDNYATPKYPKVQRWFARHPTFRMHLTPPARCGPTW